MLAFAGDVIAQDGVKSAAAANGWDAVLGAVAGALHGADLALVNVETPITSRAVRRGDMIFHADASRLASLRASGFDVASFANNHVYDQGHAGLVDSLAALEHAGFVTVGAGPSLADACRPRLLERGGIRVAILARTLVLNFHDEPQKPTEPDVCMLAEGPLKRHAAEARRAGADLVVASLHWGNEYERAPRVDQIDAAHRLLAAGVDVVVGHHPHVVQPVERRRLRDGRDTLVAYSLGNLVSNQGKDFDAASAPADDGDVRDAVVLRVTVSRRADGHVGVDDVAAVPLWTENDRRTGAITLVPSPAARRAHLRARLGEGVVLGDEPASTGLAAADVLDAPPHAR